MSASILSVVLHTCKINARTVLKSFTSIEGRIRLFIGQIKVQLGFNRLSMLDLSEAGH